MPVACFDLEGPLSPQDNAYEVLGLVPRGKEIFEVISRYDDLLTLEGREDYEPGDTLKLIVPFLIYHGITEKDIERVSKRAKIVEGAKETVAHLREKGWKVHIISTSYQQHAHNIAAQLGVAKEDVACTRLKLSRYRGVSGVELVEEVEKVILERLYPRMRDEEIVSTLDDFFFGKLQRTELGRVFNEVRVVGGQRKVEAMLRFLERDGAAIDECAAVGDSITDFKMLKEVSRRGGMAVAFNGNEYCLPYCDVAVASTKLSAVLPLLDAFAEGGRSAALERARSLEGEGNEAAYTLFPGESEAKLRRTLEVHRRFRAIVRGDAAKLG
ncbi:MAG: HAD family hydrolase [Euryarchaeota archaeon]|nr:HAD family hydrolase [Euryarchaeota archaeon]